MIASPTLLLATQADGIGLNTVTFGIVSAVVVALAGVISLLWRYATSREARYIDRLEKENDRLEQEKHELMDALIDSLRTGHRAVDAADEAAMELLKRRTKRPK